MFRVCVILISSLQIGCAHRYALAPLNQPECPCEKIRLVGDTAVCYNESSVLKFTLDSIYKVERRPRLGGTLAMGGAGACLGGFAGTIVGAVAAWSSSTKTPEPYIFIPMLLGSTVGFFAGKSIWTILDTQTLFPMSLPATTRKQEVEIFVQ